MINDNPSGWYEARWPLPRPSSVRDVSRWQDTEGRMYAPLSDSDVTKLSLSSKQTWWWAASPSRGQLDDLEAGTRLRLTDGSRRRVVDVGVSQQRFRKVCVVAIK